MKNFLFSCLFLLTIIFLWTSCQKEYISNEIEISGKILNEQEEGLDGVLLQIANEDTYTDGNGNFQIKISNLSQEKRFVLKASLSGYMSKHYSFIIEAGNKYQTSLILRKPDRINSFSISSGGTINMPSGASVLIPANGVTLMDGTPYTGSMVNIAVQEINESKGLYFSDMIPGNTLTAINTNGNIQELYSYGMLNVELQGDNGEALQLRTGSTSSLTFTIPMNQLGSAPNTIPLWYFDEEIGLWKEEGTAVKQGNKYVGTVNHFSSWNIDIPYPPCTISGCVEDNTGAPQVGLRLQVGQVSAMTDANGCFSVAIPAHFLPIKVLYNDYNSMTSCELFNVFNTITPNTNYSVGTLIYSGTCGGVQDSWTVEVPKDVVLAPDSTGEVKILIKDITWQGVPGVLVNYSILSGNGSINMSQNTTDIDGISTVEWTLGPSGVQLLSIMVGNQTYMVRAWDPVMGTMTDSRDGEVYETVTFANGQRWMAENLRYSALGIVNPNNPNAKYGRLYKWSTMMNGENSSNRIPSGVKGICPDGWHVPSDLEWKELEKTLGMTESEITVVGLVGFWRGKEQGVMMKSTTGWINPNGSSANGSNRSKFNVLPAGDNQFFRLGNAACFWTSREYSNHYAYSRELDYLDLGIRYETEVKHNALSCRCVED